MPAGGIDIEQISKDARALNGQEARILIQPASQRNPDNARLWRVYEGWFELTSKEALGGMRRALDIDPNSLNDRPQGALLARLSGLVRHDFLVDESGMWEDRSNGTGDPILERPACPDRKFSGSRFYVPIDPRYEKPLV